MSKSLISTCLKVLILATLSETVKAHVLIPMDLGFSFSCGEMPSLPTPTTSGHTKIFVCELQNILELRISLFRAKSIDPVFKPIFQRQAFLLMFRLAAFLNKSKIHSLFLNSPTAIFGHSGSSAHQILINVKHMCVLR